MANEDGLIRAGLPALAYGGALGTLFFMLGSVYNTVLPTPAALIFAAAGFLFGASVKLADSF